MLTNQIWNILRSKPVAIWQTRSSSLSVLRQNLLQDHFTHPTQRLWYSVAIQDLSCYLDLPKHSRKGTLRINVESIVETKSPAKGPLWMWDFTKESCILIILLQNVCIRKAVL